MINSIYLRLKNKVYIKAENNALSEDYLLNLLVNIEGLGFTFSEALVQRVSTLSIENFNSFYDELVATLKVMVGADVVHEPMYKNFPKEVKKLSKKTLYANAFMHYLGSYFGISIMPESVEKERKELKKNVVKLKVIDLGNIAEFESIFSNLLSAKSSISEDDKSIIEAFIKSYKESIFALIPKEISHKENAAFLIGKLINEKIAISKAFAAAYIPTATDVLRIAVAICKGDVSLAKPTKFKSISKANRRFLLENLERIGFVTEDMLRYKEQWKRLGECLHPFEYKNKYAKACAAFDIVRNNKAFESFASLIEKGLVKKDINAVVKLLQTRPGELARRLDQLLRLSDNKKAVLESFEAVAKNVSSAVLLQMQAHFKARPKAKDLRLFTPKGMENKIQAIDNNLPILEKEICEKVVAICNNALIEKFKTYKPLGKVYLDEKLADYTVPLSQRSASKALVSIPKGSKIDFPNASTIRLFVYWKEGGTRADIDLSVLGLDKEHKFVVQIAYYNLKEFDSYYSGDITSAPNGASEFIDINIADFLEKNVRYVVMCLNSFTQQPYCDLPICFAGFMMRNKPNSGEIYEAKTVVNKFDISANTRISIPMILDLKKHKIIWSDLSLTYAPNYSNNVHNNMSSISLMAKAMTKNLVKPNLYDLLALHIKARGTLTNDIEKADTVFSVEKGIKPSDIDVLISQFL